MVKVIALDGLFITNDNATLFLLDSLLLISMIPLLLYLRFSFRKKELTSREIYLGQLPDEDFPPNFICNQVSSFL